MKLDNRILTGLVLGVVVGLHYHATLVAYLPLLMIAGIILLLKTLHN